MLMQDGGRGSMILTFCIDQDLQKTCRIPIISQMCSKSVKGFGGLSKIFNFAKHKNTPLSNVQCIYFTSLSNVQYIYFFLGWELEKQPKLR